MVDWKPRRNRVRFLFEYARGDFGWRYFIRELWRARFADYRSEKPRPWVKDTVTGQVFQLEHDEVEILDRLAAALDELRGPTAAQIAAASDSYFLSLLERRAGKVEGWEMFTGFTMADWSDWLIKIVFGDRSEG